MSCRGIGRKFGTAIATDRITLKSTQDEKQSSRKPGGALLDGARGPHSFGGPLEKGTGFHSFNLPAVGGTKWVALIDMPVTPAPLCFPSV